ncbi:hypothetical protein [Jeotgalibacillus campisalis]|uniref:Group-specific protein n=1 Tax=Jeotgalibacillus campisalis TaxID=220754 RepID=A0A0C2VVZ8_9BACL|nr:hypothetical protein [Jeotgalibacillus campisalis]KIL53047.1 hypothetical protein KR50_03760 [Jeotgalibacillus campisalis]
MSCTIDHSHDEVRQKLVSQHEYLPKEIFTGVEILLQSNLDQERLNQIFHLLKKYDLASEDEKLHRNRSFEKLIEENGAG